MLRAALITAAALTLSACASTGGPGLYERERAKLEADCAARDGILTPLRGGTGRAATDYACEIRGAASPRLP
jgi:hypothetical protein